MIHSSRPVALFWLVMIALAVAAPSLADDRLVIRDQDGRGSARITETGDGSLNIYDARSNRVGYGIRRRDGSIDLFRPDGSRLGYIEPASPSAGSGTTRIFLSPNRR